MNAPTTTPESRHVSAYSTREKIGRMLWAIAQTTLFRLSPPTAYGWRRFLLQIGVACGVMAVMLANFVPPVAAWLEADVWTRCLWLAAAVVGGVVIYGVALLAVGLRPAALKLSGGV